MSIYGLNECFEDHIKAIQADQWFSEERDDQRSQFTVNIGDGEGGLEDGQYVHHCDSQPFVRMDQEGTEIGQQIRDDWLGKKLLGTERVHTAKTLHHH